ncbi:hypothetical protein [Spongiimicrobium sp. 2-473A-2-J]|uniref:hypothetical protein n=1 Tax=Eudoraea algarum TaxID=3417568 RepID=UPI003D36B1AB
MEKALIVTIVIAIFLVLSLLFNKILKGYVKESFGKKWLSVWGNKVYFWQSLVFVSLAGTALIVYLLKWTNVLIF